jgi:hypothetical protein
LNEKFLVNTGTGASKSATGATQARVRAIIQPKSRNDNTADKNGELLTLKPAAKITPRVD